MKSHITEASRYIINGLFATAVHYGALTVNISFIEFKSAGFANFTASIFGITASFLGSRYFVFKSTTESILRQMVRFCGLYGAIAILHGVILWIWSDLNKLDYRSGFLIATAIQVSMSYIGNKFLVFRS